ncbi:hypothetical protein MMC18_005324 [Xylographa bjoerkii]|nr:hypothetical protein [Xylographa bjoerkii]
MPSDIRSFFGGKGAQSTVSSQEKPARSADVSTACIFFLHPLRMASFEYRPSTLCINPISVALPSITSLSSVYSVLALIFFEISNANMVATFSQAKPTKARGRPKRKVVSDTEDEVEENSTKKSTPKKAPPKKLIKRDSPKGEVTTTSDYFASNGKSKPVRSTPSKPKLSSDKKTRESNGKPQIDIETPKATPKPTPKTTPKTSVKANAEATTNSARSSRTSTRKRPRMSYVDNDDDDNERDLLISKADDDSGEDIFGADYKRGGKKMEDAYESDEEEEEPIKPTRQARSNGGTAMLKKERNSKVKKEDEEMKETDMEDDFEVPDPKEKVKSSKPVNRIKANQGRKRKSVDLSDDEDGEDSKPAPKKAGSARATPAKRAKTPSKKEKVEDSKEIKDILDSIPTIRPPTPPPRDGDKKFDFKGHASRAQPAPAAGSKEIPVGADNCLAGLTFVFTGLLDALGREEGQELVKRYGAKVTSGPSSKTSYVVLGTDAGPKKLETIAKYGLKTINEDGLFQLIRLMPADGGDSKAAGKFEEKKQAEERKILEAAEEMEREEQRSKKLKAATEKSKAAAEGNVVQAKAPRVQPGSDIDSRLWTVKYAPSAANQVVGNKQQLEKLQNWLRAFPKNARTHFKMPGKDGSGTYRAVMIHGGPGIGKTTAAHLAAKLEGYDVVESNASDTRSKKLVESGLKGVLDTTSLLGYFAGDGKKADVEKKKLVLIMDEVDGMSAGDRGGVGALAAVCKKSRIPMILICNDRKQPKMKPFDHVTYELPFRKPTTDQIRTRIMTIIFREGMKDLIPTTVVNALIEGSRADIRQIINMLSTAKLDQQSLDFDGGKKMSKAWEKHIILRPWDIVGKILGGGLFAPNSNSTLNDKIELYFNDHEFSSLMLQENYLGTTPVLAHPYSGKEKNLKTLELADRAAESISDGDLVDRMIHGSQQQWSLMPTHAVLSFVRPASFIAGSMGAGGQTRFTSWLGNNSKLGKFGRLVKDIQGHMRLRASGDRHEIRQQYLPVLWTRLVKALEYSGSDISGIEEIIALMDSYFLTKDDWDSIYELGVGPQRVEKVELSTGAKTAFTRTYNKMSHPLPFMKAGGLAPMKKAKEVPDLEEAIEESDDGDEILADAADDDEEELDLKKDKYVTAAKKKAAPKKAAAKKAKSKVKKEDDEEDEEMDSEEDVKPAKGKGKGKATAARGRPKK